MPPKGPNKAMLDKIKKEQERKQALKNEEKAFKDAQAEEARKEKELEEQKLKEAELRKQQKAEEKKKLMALGLYKSKKQIAEEEAARIRREELLNRVQLVNIAPTGKQQPSKSTSTGPQSEFEKMRLETERLKQEQMKFKQYCIERFHKEQPIPFETMSNAETILKESQSQLKQLQDELKQLQDELQAAEADEVVDDWELDDDDNNDGNNASKILQDKIQLNETNTQDLVDNIIPKAKSTYNDAKIFYQQELDVFEKLMIKEQQQIKEAERLEQLRIEEMASQQHLGGGHDGEKSMRAPIVVILGHVDSGKTSLMDKIRASTVAAGEAGGITQQIGSSFVPSDTIISMCEKYKKTLLNPTATNDTPDEELIPLAIERHGLPGLLCIDTPGHESFSMLRERGGDICDVAILIVDIQKGLQKQTIESIQILQKRGTPFIIAVTKVDALYGWDMKPENQWNPIRHSLDKANDMVNNEFERAYEKAMVQFAEQEINVKLFWENDDPSTYHNLVPVSSKTGEGIPDLMEILVEMTVSRMSARLAKQRVSDPLDFHCLVLEVKNHEGYGATLDVVLANGTIREGDRIVCAGINGPIESIVKSCLLPPANRDQRVQKDFTQVKAVHAAMGFKIVGPDLSRVLAGSALYVVPNDKYYNDICDKVQEDLSSVICDIDMDRKGVFLHASSLGSLEALITLLKQEKIPISGFDIGTVHKASVTMAATQLTKQKPEYALILAFDVKVDGQAQKDADREGVTIFSEDVIYHLYDKAVQHFQKVRDNQRAAHKPVFPCALKFSKDGTHNRIFHATDPILIGVVVTQGTLHIGTPLLAFFPGKSLHLTNLGTVLSIKYGQDQIKSAKKDQEVSISIGRGNLSTKPELTEKNTQADKDGPEIQFLSKMSGYDADFLLENFKEELTDDDTKLISAFKKLKLI